MGQRLNISIELDGNVLANAYYHWSAYTRPAAELIMEICDCRESPQHLANLHQ